MPALAPAWFALVTFAMLVSPDGTLVVLSELECVWSQRLFPSQRAVGGGFTVFETLLGNALTGQEGTIIAGLAALGKAEQYAQLTVTLLPTASEMAAFPSSAAAAALAMSRAFARAVSSTGALTVAVHDVLTVIPHYAPFAYSIGTDIGAPAALGLLLEAVRAALQSPTALLSLGNVAAAAELYKYLLGRLHDLHRAHKPPSERVTFIMSELADRRRHESASRGASSHAQAASGPATTARHRNRMPKRNETARRGCSDERMRLWKYYSDGQQR